MKKIFLLAFMFLSACSSDDDVVMPTVDMSNMQTFNNNAGGTVDIDPSERGTVFGIGIQGHDIVGMSEKMMRDMLSVPDLAGHTPAARIIIDSEFFTNESSQAINKNLITDRLRVQLNREAKGRMIFVGREYAGMVARERDLKRGGLVDQATTGLAAKQSGADFRLTGRITSLDAGDASNGMVQRYTQIVFEMLDLETGIIVWNNEYTIQHAGQDNVVYR